MLSCYICGEEEFFMTKLSDRGEDLQHLKDASVEIKRDRAASHPVTNFKILQAALDVLYILRFYILRQHLADRFIDVVRRYLVDILNFLHHVEFARSAAKITAFLDSASLDHEIPSDFFHQGYR